MSLGRINSPVDGASHPGERVTLALVRDSSAKAENAPRAAASDPTAAHRGAGDPASILADWRRVHERLGSFGVEADLSDGLGCWLRVGAEPLGALGGVIEIAVAPSCEIVRGAFGVSERSAHALASTAIGGSVPVPSATELTDDIALSAVFGGLLVHPFLESDGVRSVLSMPIRSKLGISGVARYLFAERVAADDVRCTLAELLSQRIIDLVERRLLWRRAAAAETRLHSVLDGAGASIITVAPDGRIIEANDATAMVFGYRRSDLRGLPLASIFPSSCERLLSANAFDGRAEPRALEFEAVRSDGSTFVADIVVGSGALQVGRTLVVRDASARRSAEAQMRQCERLAAVGTLVAGLGHDLNNTLLPMRAHATALSKLDRPRAGNTCAPHWRALNAGLAHLQSLADSLHFLAIDVDVRPGASTDLEGWWRDAGPLLGKALDGRATLETVIDPSLPHVLLDERSLARVAMCVLVNAGEAMPGGRPRELARVLLRARRSACGASVVLEVADNGVGMTDEVRRRAFDAYFTTKMRGIGTGLGLPIARAIVERVGGRIEIDTRDGIGTTVRIELPSECGAPDGTRPLRVACTVRDGRLAAAIRTALAAEGVLDVAGDPSAAGVWIVEGDALKAADAERWLARGAAARMIIVGPPAADACLTAATRGATLLPDARDLVSITAALANVLASAKAVDIEEEQNHG
jgi:PAS domain S-box-containing protein